MAIVMKRVLIIRGVGRSTNEQAIDTGVLMLELHGTVCHQQTIELCNKS